MAWSWSKGQFGVCGNFRFLFVDLTDVKSTRSIPLTEGFNSVKFTSSTNTTDNTDVLLIKKVSWTGTADGDTANELVDSSETFDPAVSGLQCDNTTDTTNCVVDYKDADELYCKAYNGAAADTFPDGTDTFTIYNERRIEIIAGTANDDGTILMIGD